jgi:putative transposase
MINRKHDLPITKQAQVLRISRGSVYYLPRPMPEADLAIMRRLDRLHLNMRLCLTDRAPPPAPRSCLSRHEGHNAG